MLPIHFPATLKHFSACIAACLALALIACGGAGRSNTITIGSNPTQFLFASSVSAAGTTTTAFRVASNGSLTSLGTALQSATPTILVTADPSGHHVFGFTAPVSGTQSLVTFSVQPGTGTLQHTSTAALPPNTALTSGIALNPAGTFLFAALRIVCCSDIGQSTGLIATYSVDSAGNLTLMSMANGSFGVSVLTPPIAMVVNSAGSFLYAAINDPAGTASILQFAIGGNGALTQVSSLQTALLGGDNFAIAPNGKTLYWGMFAFPQVATFSVDPATGNLTEGPTVDCNCGGNIPAGQGPDQGRDIIVNARGTLLFEATAGESLPASAVAAYGINPGTGALTPFPNAFIEVESQDGPAVALDSTGTFLFTTGTGVNQVLGFSVSDSGVVTPVPGSPFTQAGGDRLLMVNFKP